MATMIIPARHREGLSRIRTLDQQDVRDIRAALDTVTDASDGPISAASEAVIALKSGNSGGFKQIAEALGSLYVAKSTRDLSPPEFANDICDAMEALDSEFRLPQEEREQFKAKLITLLGADFFALASKAWDLRTDDEHVFCTARVLTDLRPVFGSRVDEGPKAMVVVHLLRIGYDVSGRNEKHEDFYVSLSAEGLRTLRDALERAEAKAKSLGAAMKGFRLLGLPKE
jgi:hypothetical protein